MMEYRPVGKSRVVKARVMHSCTECDRAIKVGEYYTVQAVVNYYARPRSCFTWKRCAVCKPIIPESQT
jgi:hypothetical protein